MKNKRLDDIEVQLTPNQWAIRLANEMRRYPSEKDFLAAIAKGSYRQTPYIAPFHALAQQAKQHWPGPDEETVRKAIRLDLKLRGEFHALKQLIINANEAIKNKADSCRVKTALRLTQLQAIIQEDAFAQSATKAARWIEQCTTTTTPEIEDRQLIVKELVVHAYLGAPETIPGKSGNARAFRLLSLCRDWADSSAVLLPEIVAQKNAIYTIHERYFDHREILFKDIEAALEAAIQAVREAIALFHEYQEHSGDPSRRRPDRPSRKVKSKSTARSKLQGDKSIDIEAVEQLANALADAIVAEWETNAKNKGTSDVLSEIQEHEGFIWEGFQKRWGARA